MLGALAPAAKAQSFTGTWEIFPNYGTPATVVETPEYVYTLAGTSLCGYDKTTDEVTAFNSGNRLNGNQVSGIWYDPQEKYLMVVHTDYNIDLLYDDGRTINVPDLRDAPITQSKQVNSVAFSDGKAYIGLSSGMLVMDAAHGAITESCLWGFKVDYIAATAKKILVFSTATQGGGKWRVADKTGSHHNFEKAFAVSSTSPYPHGAVVTLGPDAVMLGNETNAYCIKIDNEATDNSKAIVSSTKIEGVSGLTKASKNKMQVSKSGATASGSGKLFHISPEGKLTGTHNVPTTGIAADWNHEDGAAWIADTNGYGKYDLATGNYAISPTKPNSTSGTNVGIFRQLPDGTVYMSTVGLHMNALVYNIAFNTKSFLDRFNNGIIQNVESGVGTSICSLSLLDNSDFYLSSNFSAGIVRRNMNDAKNVAVISSTFESNRMIMDVASDNDGNLWAVQQRVPNQDAIILYKALPGWIDNAPESVNWSSVTIPGILPNHSTRFILDEAKRNIIVTGRNGIAVVKMPSATDPLTTSIRSSYCDMSVDEDGLSFGGWKFPTLAIDKNGWIWGGNDSGVYIIKNSDDMFTPGWAPMRPKVARNDGTNLADFLLDQVEVFHIAVDENNQKWISTIGSGLYRVSADGSQIIEHFTTDNSQLPSNNVFACLPDKFSNKIFIGTDQGLAIYHSTTAPAAPDYSDVYAFPNPVTPDYTGWITVTGLMDDSLVKIADAAGRVFFEGKSDGGMITWNGCDSSGRRVKSGVYFVFASQHQDGASSNAAVTKIVVVN